MKRRRSFPDRDNAEIPARSRTRKKKEVEVLQKMGERLLEISSEKRSRLGLPDELREALDQMDSVKGRQAVRRQRQRIGVIMRHIDPEPVKAVLEEMDSGARMDAWRHRRAGEIRNLLLSGEAENAGVNERETDPAAIMEDLIRRCPDLDRTRLRTLIRNGEKEAAASKKKGAGKKLFCMIRDCLEAEKEEGAGG